MNNYTVDPTKKWDYENGFYLTAETSRFGKLLSHLEIYKKIIDIPGDVLEFGVYKGSSIVRFLTFRELFETQFSRKIVGFDMFGKFPDELALNEDKEFVKKFESQGGDGISREELDTHLNRKGFVNYELVKGNINQTLPEWIEANPQRRFSLIHIDVDVYEPTITILNNVFDKLVKGGILVLDDYTTVLGETLAVEEFIKSRSLMVKKFPYNYIPSYIQK